MHVVEIDDQTPSREPGDSKTHDKSTKELLKECIFNRKTVVRLILFVAIATLIGLLFAFLPFEDYMYEFLHFMHGLGVIGGVIFVAIYIVASVILIPTTILNLAAGFIYGVWVGSLYVWIGGTIGNMLAFLAGKFLFLHWATWFTDNFKAMSILSRTIERNQWKIMFLLRISPIMPYSVLNYSLAMVKNLRLVPYFVTETIGLLPGSVLYVYFGSVARDLEEVVSGETGESTVQLVLLIVGLVLTLGIVIAISIVASREIRKEMQNDLKKKEVATEKTLLLP